MKVKYKSPFKFLKILDLPKNKNQKSKSKITIHVFQETKIYCKIKNQKPKFKIQKPKTKN